MFWVGLLLRHHSIELTPAAIFYNLVNSAMDNVRGKHDVINTLTAGFASGAAYKATGQPYVPESRHQRAHILQRVCDPCFFPLVL